MGKPDNKLKKTILIVGVTGAVYGSFKYLLPLVIPFLIAGGIALLLRPSAEWVSRKCRIRVGGKNCGIPAGVVGAVELVAFIAIMAVGIYYGGRKLYLEAGLLADRIPVWIDGLDQWLTGACHGMEALFCLKKDVLVRLMREMLRELLETVKNGIMPYLMANSVAVFRAGVNASVISVVILISVSLSLQEMDRWGRRCRNSVYRREFSMIAHRLAIVGNAYLKTQGVIMLLTTAICTTGFWLLKNPYYILAGIGIGLLDALPIFGTGTVLIPWALILFVKGQWGRGIAILILYLVCYFLREILEAKMMGDRVGLSPMETLVSMYVGLQLFGIVGFILGPVGLLLIEDLVQVLDQKPPNRSVL